MGSEYRNEQKCLLEIDGQPILKQVLGALAIAFSRADVTILTSHKSQEVHDFVRKNTPKGLTVEFMDDNGHSNSTYLYKSTRGLTRGTFVGTAGDIVVEPHIYSEVRDAAANSDAIAAVAMATDVTQVDTHALGKIKDGLLTELSWPPPTVPDEDHLRDMTVWGINQSFYEYADQNPDRKAFPQLIIRALEEEMDAPAVLYEGQWVHVGYPHDLNKSMDGTIYSTAESKLQ